MKKRSLFFCLFFSFLGAHNNQELFLKANQLYDQKDYKKAFLVYESIKNKGSAVWYNMGHCCYMQEEFVKALLFYKRAAKSASMPFYAEIQEQIKKIESEKLGLLHEQSWISDFVRMTAHRLSLFISQLIFLLIWFLFCFFIAKIIIGRRYFIVSILLLALVCIGGILKSKYLEHTTRYALVMQDGSFFVGPSDKLAVIGNLKRGQEVIIKAEKEGWYKIEVGQNTFGWLPHDAVIEI